MTRAASAGPLRRPAAFLLPALIVHLYGPPVAAQAPAGGLMLGADVSHLDRVEESGGVFFDASGVAADALDVLRDHGVSWIRLRLWHTPAEGYSNLERTLYMARRIKDAGMHFLLDVHYSDTWADPGRQTKPQAWQGLDFEVLKDSVRTYTARVLSALKAQGTLPEAVQLGNEITVGMLWPDGRVGGSDDTPEQWRRLAGLLEAGMQGVEEAAGDSVEIMIHIDRGGDPDGSRWFFENLVEQEVEFDLIGLSFYRWWHGKLSDLEGNLQMLANQYQKGIVVVETAYPWTLEYADDNQHNIVGQADQLHPGYPASVDGQRAFLSDLIAVVRSTPDGLGRGVFYWEPAHIPAPEFGSPWENLALFDFDGHVLASAGAFRDAATVGVEDAAGPRRASPTVVTAYPNPFRDAVTIRYEALGPASVEFRLYDVLGRLHRHERGLTAAGTGTIVVDAGRLPSGPYLYRLMLDGREAASGILMLQK